MSFWEGSTWQDEMERRKAERQQLEERVRRENPSLRPDDVREWAAKEYERLHPRPVARCCPCRGQERAEIVRVKDYLGPCRCDCHRRWREPVPMPGIQ